MCDIFFKKEMSVFYLTNKSNTTVKLSSLGTNGKNMRIQKTGR